MKNDLLSNLTTGQLRSREKLATVGIVMVGTAMVLMFLVGIFFLWKKNMVMVVLPVAFLPLLILNINQRKKVRAELASRGE